MAPTKSMSARQCDDTFIIESHARKDLAEVRGAQRTGGKPTMRHALTFRTDVRAPSAKGDLRPSHLLDGDDRCECPEIGEADGGVALFVRREVGSCDP